MRNLKRALSLTLASVMLLGMMVVGSGAAAGYDDVKETDNVEAIEVLQAVEVMVGDDRGFGPDRPVNRAEMAVVMGKLLNLDYNYYVSTCPFTDVSGNYDWARGWVGACAANGIVSGRGNGVYDPGATVTAVEAASMMMRALGYFKYTEDYADGFNVVTVRQGSQIGIFNGVGTDANTPMTRNQVAQMALNALESEMVTFIGTPGVNVNGVTVGYRAEYTPRTSTESKYQAIERRTSDVSGGNNLNRGQYYIQLGEELYNGDLVKRDDTDAFERPSNTWLYKSKEIGTYVDYDLLVANGSYTDEVKYSELYDLLTYTTIRDYDLNRFVDGVEVSESKDNFRRSNSEKVGGRGVLTEVFVDKDTDEITITSINTYLAKANTSYSTNTETASLKVYTRSDAGKPVTNTYSVDVDDVPEVEGVEKDEFMLVYLSGKDGAASTETDYNRFEVVNLFDTEIMSDAEVTKFSTSGTKVVDKLTTGGTEYKTNPKAFYDKDEDVLGIYDQELLSDTTYNIYMDRYENVIGVDLYDGSRNYVFITGFDRGNSHISTKTADAAAIFLDGTMETITVNVTDTDKNIDRMNGSTNDNGASGDPYFVQWQDSRIEGRVSENRWYTYTVSGNGTYTLKPAARMFATDYDYKGDGIVTLDSANLYVQDNGTDDILNTGNQINPGAKNKGRAYGEDESVYITVETGAVDKDGGDHTIAITDVQGVYKGAQDVKMDLTAAAQGHVPNAVYTLYDSDSYIIAAIVVGEARGASANYAYITSGVKSERVEKNSSTRANDYTYYWEFEAFYNGEIQTLTAKTDYPATQYDLDKYTVRELRFNGEYVSDVVAPRYGKIQNNNTDNSRIDDMDVYDVGQIAVTENDYWPDTTGNSKDWYVHGTGVNLKGYEWDGDKNNPAGDTEARLEGTIYLQGRTLYIEQAGRRDIGLALGRDIPALLVQNENRYNNDPEKRVYTSVDEAVSNIADCSNAAGTQFRGRIAAALDGKGVAQWVVIISDKTLWTGKDPNYNVTSSRLTWNEAGEYWDLYIPGWKDGQANSATVIRNALADCGCTNISRTGSLWNFTYAGTEYALQIVNPYDNGQVVVPVTGVTVRPTTAEVEVGKTVTLTATVAPADATNKTVSWKSSDSSIATVSGGVVTGVKAGTATITVTTADGGKTADCTVTVEEAVQPGEDVTVTIKGTAVKDNHYTTDLPEDGKIEAGKTFTITANKHIAVYEGTTRTEMNVDDPPKTFTATENTTIFINRFATRFVGDTLTEVEKKAEGTPEVPAAASMAAYARAAGDFVTIRLVLENGEYATTETYVVKDLGGGSYKFGKDTTPTMRTAIEDAFDAADLANVDIEIEQTGKATADQIDAWNGEPTEPTKTAPYTYDVQAVIGDAVAGKPSVVSFKVHFTDDKQKERVLNETEIAQALTNANHATLPGGVNLKTGEITTKSGVEHFTLVNAASGSKLNNVVEQKADDSNSLFKITWPGNTTGIYLPATTPTNVELTHITDGITYLIPDKYVQSQGRTSSKEYNDKDNAVIKVEKEEDGKGKYYEVDSGKTIDGDINYVEAIPVDKGMLAGAGVIQKNFWNSGLAYVFNVGVLYGSQTAPTTATSWKDGQWFVPKGTKLVLTQDAASKTAWVGKDTTAITLSVNGGAAITVPVDKVTKEIGKIEPIVIDDVNYASGTIANPLKVFTLEVDTTEAADVVVRVNGVDTGLDLNDSIDKCSVKLGTEGGDMTVVYYAATSDAYKVVDNSMTVNALGYGELTTAAVKTLINSKALAPVDGIIDLYTAYGIRGKDADPATVWTMYTDKDCTRIAGPDDATTYIPANPDKGEYQTLYVKAVKPNTVLVWKDSLYNTAATRRLLTIGETVTDAVKAPGLDGSNTTKGVWAVTVNRNILAGDIVEGIHVTYTAGNAITENEANLAEDDTGAKNAALGVYADRGHLLVTGLDLYSLEAVQSVKFEFDTKYASKKADWSQPGGTKVPTLVANSDGDNELLDINIWALDALNDVIELPANSGAANPDRIGRLTITLVNGWSFGIDVNLRDNP